MDNTQLYFYYFQWQTAPPQTHSSISSHHYSRCIVSLKTLVFGYLYFVQRALKIWVLLRKAPSFSSLKNLSWENMEKNTGSVAAPSSLLSAFPECQVCQCCRNTEGSSSSPMSSPASCGHTTGRPFPSSPRSKQKCPQEVCAPWRSAVLQDQESRRHFLHHPGLFFS